VSLLSEPGRIDAGVKPLKRGGRGRRRSSETLGGGESFGRCAAPRGGPVPEKSALHSRGGEIKSSWSGNQRGKLGRGDNRKENSEGTGKKATASPRKSDRKKDAL